VTKPEILTDLVKVPPYTEVIHQVLFKCTLPIWVSVDVGCKAQNWQPNISGLVNCHGLRTPHVPLHQVLPWGRLPIARMDVWRAVLLFYAMDKTNYAGWLATGACAWHGPATTHAPTAVYWVLSDWIGPVLRTVQQEPPGSWRCSCMRTLLASLSSS
jgi:hypothetical protein